MYSDDDEMFNILDDLVTDECLKCECGFILVDRCEECGMTTGEVELICHSNNLYDNYIKTKKTVYSRFRYMKIYLTSFLDIHLTKYSEEVYNAVIEGHKKVPLMNFKTYFHRIGMFDKSEYIYFKYYKDKDKININGIQECLRYEKVRTISNHYNRIKFPNRNLLIYYYYPEVYNHLKELLHMTEATKDLYSRTYMSNC